jgi:hypothetical protein
MSKRWSYAVLVVAMGCGNTPINNTPVDAQVGNDVVGQDVVDAGGGGQDVVDAGSARPDVVDAATAADVVDAAMAADVVDAGEGKDGGMVDVPVATDVPAATDVPVATDVATDVPVDAPPVCPTPTGTISLPGMVAPLMGTTSGRSILPASGCQSSTGGPEHVYTLTVTAPTGVQLSTEGMATNFDTVVSIRRSCLDVMSEVACDDDSGDAPGTSSFLRTTLMPGTYTVVVDGFASGMGNYVLNASSFTVAANATCAGATALTTTGLTAQSLAGGLNRATTCLTGGGGQLYYTVSVAPGTQATVRATPTGMTPTWTPQLRLLDDCAATTCLQNASGTSGMPGSLTFANNGTTMRSYVLSVSASSPLAVSGTFDLSLATQMLMPGASCEMALDVPAGMGRMGENTMNGGPANTVCQTGLGQQRWFRVSIPAGQRLNVTATPGAMSGRRAAMRFLDSCAATTCLDSTGGTTNAASTLGVNNAGTTARTAFLSVSGESTTMPMAFDLATALVPIMPSGVCESPVALPNGMAVNGDTGRGLARPTRCQTTDLSNEVFFSVTVPAGQRTAVLVTPAMGATWRPRVRGLTGCDATGCFANIAATTDGGAATLNLDNPSQLPRTMIVSVSTTTAMTGGAFTITATDGPLPTPRMPRYTLAMIPASCDDVAMGTAVAPSSGWSDDSTTAIAALPFSVPFFGVAQTHFSVASNGFAMLYPSMTGTASSTLSNQELPSASTPNNVVAPFWDDLNTATGVTSEVRTMAMGTAPNQRFVIAWNNWRTFSGSATTERLTFQAKLFETTGVVEFHYCNVTPGGTAATGSGATIGIEDAMGMFGNLVGYNYPNIIATGRGYRLTPPM